MNHVLSTNTRGVLIHNIIKTKIARLTLTMLSLNNFVYLSLQVVRYLQISHDKLEQRDLYTNFKFHFGDNTRT